MKVDPARVHSGRRLAFTISFAAPAFLSELASAQGASRRNLVVLVSGGRQRRARARSCRTRTTSTSAGGPRSRVPAGNVIQIGTDSVRQAARAASAAHRASSTIFDDGHLALIQRSGLPELEPIAFSRHRHLVHGQSDELDGTRLARPVSRYAAVAGRSARRLVHDRGKCRTRSSASRVSVPAIPSPTTTRFRARTRAPRRRTRARR